MSWSDTIKNLMKAVTGEAIQGMVDNVKTRIEDVTRKAIKASVIYVLMFIGLVFLLVGLANWLQAYYSWLDGIGFMVVGGAILLLGVIVKALR